MATQGVTQELELLGKMCQDAFGVIGQSPEEFETLFTTLDQAQGAISSIAWIVFLKNLELRIKVSRHNRYGTHIVMFRSSVACHRYTYTWICSVFLFSKGQSLRYGSHVHTYIHAESSVFVHRNKQAGAKRWYTVVQYWLHPGSLPNSFSIRCECSRWSERAFHMHADSEELTPWLSLRELLKARDITWCKCAMCCYWESKCGCNLSQCGSPTLFQWLQSYSRNSRKALLFKVQHELKK